MKNSASRVACFLYERWPIILSVSVVLFIVAMVPISVWMGAKAKARMYEQVTGQKVDPVDIFWGGSPPTQDVQVRTSK